MSKKQQQIMNSRNFSFIFNFYILFYSTAKFDVGVGALVNTLVDDSIPKDVDLLASNVWII